MHRPDHQLKEISLKVLAHVAVAALYGAAYLYGTSKEAGKRQVRPVISTPKTTEQRPFQEISKPRPLVDRIQQNGDYVINLEGVPSADDFEEIRIYCGSYAFPARKDFDAPLPITTPKTLKCKNNIQRRQVMINP